MNSGNTKFLVNSLTFNITLADSNIILKCNDRSEMTANMVAYSNNQKIFPGLPFSKDYQQSKDMIFVWMGNIGPYKGYNDVFYYTYDDQLLGCFGTRSFNNKLIQFGKQGQYFLSSCIKRINESCKRKVVTEVNVLLKPNI